MRTDFQGGTAHTFDLGKLSDHWVRIGKQVVCGSMYSYRQIWVRILANALCESQFSQLLVNLCENARKCG